MANELQPRDDRPSYAAPQSLRLGAQRAGSGQCISNGSGDTDICELHGNTANLECFNDGNSASATCSSNGNTAVANCVAGNGYL